MEKGLEDLVRRRAGGRCEYCHFPRGPFHIEHIIPQKHAGSTVAENLALACMSCNLHKGPNLSGIDPQTGKVVQLFNPRTDRWHRHFKWSGPRVLGVSPIGRATVLVLAMNHSMRVGARVELIASGTMRVKRPREGG
jgi:hypothetical protein